MKKLLPLMQREWLQHRFGWTLMAGIPLGLALLLLGFGHIQIGSDTADEAGPALAPLVAIATIAGSTAVMFLIAWVSSLIIVSGMARRDHADRSIEFWMSLPATHSESLAAPLIVHLLLVPAAALLIGMASGWVLAMVTVGRVVGLGAWFGLPWGAMLAASFSLTLRLLAGLPLATLWLAPLIMLIVLMSAWFRRWGWVIVGVVPAVVAPVLDKVLGQPLLSQVLKELLSNAATALVSGGEGMNIKGAEEGFEALGRIPSWALHDFGRAVADLASPLLAGGLLFAAGCFYLLVLWRQRGAGLAGG